MTLPTFDSSSSLRDQKVLSSTSELQKMDLGFHISISGEVEKKKLQKEDSFFFLINLRTLKTGTMK